MFYHTIEGTLRCYGSIDTLHYFSSGDSGICKQEPGFLAIFELKVGRKCGHLFGLYPGSRRQKYSHM